ncbi:8373_t:CDS:2, partial [Funneliformis geosporum]
AKDIPSSSSLEMIINEANNLPSSNLLGGNDIIMESLTEYRPKKTTSDWIHITNALIVVNNKDTEEEQDSKNTYI